MKNKILETFSKLHKIKKMGERTQELEAGIKKEIKIKMEIPVTVVIHWNQEDKCDIEYDIKKYFDVGANPKLRKAIKQFELETNKEIKEICDLSDQIGVLPDQLLNYYEENR